MRLTSALRNGVPALFFTSASLFSSLRSRTASSRFLVPATPPLLLGFRRWGVAVPFHFSSFAIPPPGSGPASSSLESDTTCVAVRSEKLFVEFETHLEESQNYREQIRAVMVKMEPVIAVMRSAILRIDDSHPVPEVLAKAGNHVAVLKELFGQIEEILRECPDQYYSFRMCVLGVGCGTCTMKIGEARGMLWSHCLLSFTGWRRETCSITRRLKDKFGLDASEFGLDIEDYLIGLCYMSNELPRYVVKRVRAGEHDCPRKVLKFLTDLHASFQMLDHKNDFLRKKVDGMKNDLTSVEEVLFLVKIWRPDV